MMNPETPNTTTQPQMDRPVEETTRSATEKLQEGARQIGDRLQEKGKILADKTDEALSSVGHGVTNLAGKMREHPPAQGKLGDTWLKMADGLEKGGHYLDESRFSDMQHDATELIRKYPTQSLVAGLAFGFLLGATLSAASRR